jgi:hypothetical protein
VTQQLFPAVDLLIDVHAGGSDVSVVPMVFGFCYGKSKVDDAHLAQPLMEAWGYRFVQHVDGIDETACGAAKLADLASIEVEGGGGRMKTAELEIMEEGLLRALADFGVIKQQLAPLPFSGVHFSAGPEGTVSLATGRPHRALRRPRRRRSSRPARRPAAPSTSQAWRRRRTSRPRCRATSCARPSMPSSAKGQLDRQHRHAARTLTKRQCWQNAKRRYGPQVGPIAYIGPIYQFTRLKCANPDIVSPPEAGTRAWKAGRA